MRMAAEGIKISKLLWLAVVSVKQRSGIYPSVCLSHIFPNVKMVMIN